MPEAIVTLPDGRKARLTGPSREAILEQAQALAVPAEPAVEQPPANYVARELAARGAVNSILAIPSATGDLLAGASAGAQGLVALTRGRDANFGARYAAEQDKFPASALRAIPRPTVGGITAAVKSIPALAPGGESPGEAYDRNLAAFETDEAAMRAAHPVAATVGDVGGQALSLVLARTANIKSATTWAGWGDGIRKRAEQGAQAAAGVAELAPGVARQLNAVWNSKALKSLRRGAGRAAETGIEGAALAAVNSDNPLEMAAWGAGTQAAGSFLLSAGADVFKGNLAGAGLKIAAASVGIGSVLQTIKEAAPGGRDRLLESLETGFSKVMLAIAGGALSGVAGLGRLRGGELEKNLPVIADAITSIPRGATLSLIRQMTSDDPRAPMAEAALDKLQSDPAAFSTDQLRELNRALNDGKFVDAVTRLANGNKDFRATLAAPPAGQKYQTGGGF